MSDLLSGLNYMCGPTRVALPEGELFQLNFLLGVGSPEAAER